MYPTSLTGKVVGTLCAVIGLLVLAMPIPIIANNFSKFYIVQAKHEKSIQFTSDRKMLTSKEHSSDMKPLLEEF